MKFLIWSISVVILLIGVRIEAAGIIVDQQNNATGTVDGSGVFAQTFTVGVSGYIDSVDVIYQNREPIQSIMLQIRKTSNGAPYDSPNAVLAQVTLPIMSNAGWVKSDLSSFAIPVTVGEVLAVGLDGGPRIWRASFWDQYSRGAAYTKSLYDGSWNPISNFGGADFGFITRVNTIPEPSTLILLSAGALSLLAYIWRRRKRTAWVSTLIRTTIGDTIHNYLDSFLFWAGFLTP
jgi:hypothetical protein